MFFAGEYGLLTQIIKNSLEVNFSSFFVGKGINELFSMIPKEMIQEETVQK